MAAPANTVANVPPVGRMKLEDGHSTRIGFSVAPGITLWEKTIQPPGIDGGDPIDTTTMHNSVWRTSTARSLKTLTAMSFSAAYSPAYSYASIEALINQLGSITIHFSNGDEMDFYGYMKSAQPEGLSEGGFPMMSGQIICTNTDPLTGGEEAPVYTTSAGTDL